MTNAKQAYAEAMAGTTVMPIGAGLCTHQEKFGGIEARIADGLALLEERLLARLEQQKPGAAGERGLKPVHKWKPPNQLLCGAAIDGTNTYTDGYNNIVTCPACLKLMRDGTGKEPAPPEPTIKELLGKVAAEDADMCVCGHPRSDHYYRGGVSACAVAGCACGPGCIHEGFVRADGVIEPALKSRVSEIADCPSCGGAMLPWRGHNAPTDEAVLRCIKCHEERPLGWKMDKPAPPAAPEPGKSRGEEVAEKLFEKRAISGDRRLVAAAVDAKCAAAAGEALNAAIKAVQRVQVTSEAGERLRTSCADAISHLLDAAAAPAGEGSKANG